MITKEELRQRVLMIKKGWLDDDFEESLDAILESGYVDYEKSEQNYKPAYPILAAILERCTERCLYGSSYESTRREAVRLKNKYKRNVKL